MKSPIFISYKRVDYDKVIKIKNYIESKTGLSCWIDLDGIESDAVFKNVIIKAINDCSVLLFMYSKSHTKITDSDAETDWTIKELSFASKKKKRIVFINIDGSEFTDLFEFDYGGKQHVNALDDTHLSKLASDLKKWLLTKDNNNTPTGGDQQWETSTKSHSETISISKEVPKSLLFNFNGKKLYFILSEDESYYLGNLSVDETDVSWWKNKWIDSKKVESIFAVAVNYCTPLPLWILYKGFDSLFSKYRKYVITKKHCQMLSIQIGYKVDIPTKKELEGVNEDAKSNCVVLRIKENPTLFSNKH